MTTTVGTTESGERFSYIFDKYRINAAQPYISSEETTGTETGDGSGVSINLNNAASSEATTKVTTESNDVYVKYLSDLEEVALSIQMDSIESAINKYRSIITAVASEKGISEDEASTYVNGAFLQMTGMGIKTCIAQYTVSSAADGSTKTEEINYDEAMALLNGTEISDEAQEKYNKAESDRKTSSATKAGVCAGIAGGVAGVAVGAKIGGVIGTCIPVPVVGTVIGAGLGALAGGVIGWFCG